MVENEFSHRLALQTTPGTLAGFHPLGDSIEMKNVIIQQTA
jgi:hypothetical protein